ncbi:hypothetical protein DFH09DRAFT_1406402 [Mycena vulgaris]|nr:hypothetical protein DFH09DRAFT_1406402 [Mycena vulgaris]
MQGSDRVLIILEIQADIHLRKSEYIEAFAAIQQISAKTSPTRAPHYHAHTLAVLAYLEILASGHEANILRNLNASKAAYTALGTQRILLCSRVTAELYLSRGDTKNARVAFEECLSKSRGIYTDLELECLATLGDPQHGMYGQAEILRRAVVYSSFVRKTMDRVATFHALRCLADTFFALGDDETALTVFRVTLQGATKIDIHRLRAECMVGIGNIMMHRGDTLQGREIWQAAHPLFIRSSQMKDAVGLESRLARLSESTTRSPAFEVSPKSASDSITTLDPETGEPLEKLAALSAPEALPVVKAGNISTATRDNFLHRSTDAHAMWPPVATKTQVPL